jgi:hypothetical protein
MRPKVVSLVSDKISSLIASVLNKLVILIAAGECRRRFHFQNASCRKRRMSSTYSANRLPRSGSIGTFDNARSNTKTMSSRSACVANIATLPLSSNAAKSFRSITCREVDSTVSGFGGGVGRCFGAGPLSPCRFSLLIKFLRLAQRSKAPGQ